MSKLSDVAKKIRSKNAGPFWLTIDVFCDTEEAYRRVASGLDTQTAARVFAADPAALKRFEIDDLRVVKISIPRPAVQGTREDRDMHGASFANLIADVPV